MNNSAKTHILSIVISVVAALVFALAMYVAVGAIIAKKNNVTYDYFGYSLHVVTTDSMSPDYAVQDMVFIKKCDISKVKVGDDVLYKSLDNNLNGGNILHRVVAIQHNDGITELVTMGTTQGATQDPYKVTEIIGVAKSNSQFLGKIYLMLTTPTGWIAMVIVLAGVALIAKCVGNIIKSCKLDKQKDY